MHTAFMYVSMIWKEQVYNVKYDTAESLSSKHQSSFDVVLVFVVSSV